MLCCWHCSLLMRMQFLEKMSPLLLLMIARVSGSDKLGYILYYSVKADNGNGLVAQSAQVPPYSTQLLISKLGIMMVPWSINLSTLDESSHVTINQRLGLDMNFHHHCTMMHFTIICRTFNTYFAICPSMHACLPLQPEASTHFPQIQTMLSQTNLSIWQCVASFPNI